MFLIARAWHDYDDYVEKYGRFTNPSSHARLSSVALFFEGLGILLKKGLLDVEIVSDLMSTPIRLYWEKSCSIIEAMRLTIKREQIMECAEYLYDEIVKREMMLGREKEIRDPYHIQQT